jgi:hypothetical protein
MGKMKIMTDDKKIFNYTVDKNPNLLGYSIATCPITEEITSDLKTIKEIDIAKIILTKKEIKDLNCCNIGIENLIGKYYDKNGFIYYEIHNQIYRFFLKINYFKKLYINKINGT